jgi:hypothetical protein
MITEKQKQLIFDINCFYQLESQYDKFANGKVVDFLPELSFLSIKANSKGAIIDWQSTYAELKLALQAHGLTNHWIVTLQTKLKSFISIGNTIEEFRNQFLTSIDLLVNMVMSIVKNADPSIPAEEIVESVIKDILEKNYWSGPIVQQIISVRRLSSEIGFDNDFIVEFGKAFVSFS